MTDTPLEDDPDAVRRPLLSAGPVGWSLSLATVAALGVGVFIVGGLGGPASTPPLEIQTTDPVAPPSTEPEFQILDPDDPTSDGGAFQDAFNQGDAQRQRWAESFLPKPSERFQ